MKKNKRTRKSRIKEKFVAFTGGITGFASILGSWQVCHSLCLVTIALLSILGITVAGMPFIFLQSLALPLWIIAVFLLAIILVIYFRKRCISDKLITFNTGLIMAGIPFFPDFTLMFWIVGGSLVIMSIGRYLAQKFKY